MTRPCETDSVETLLSFFKKNLTRKAPEELKNAVAGEDETEIWSVWKRILRKRTASFQLKNHFRRLFWGIDLTKDGCRTLTELGHRNNRIPYFLDEKNGPGQSAAVQFTSLNPMTESILIGFYAVCIETVFSIDSFSPSEWLGQMKEIESLLTKDASSAFSEDSLAGQLLLGEIPLFLRTAYPEWKFAVAIGKSAPRRLADGLKTTLDAVGLPKIDLFPMFRPLLAVWTRSQIMAKWAGETLFPSSTAKRFEWALLQNARLLRPDGSLALTEGIKDESARRITFSLLLEMMEEALSFDHDVPDRAAVALSLARSASGLRPKSGVPFSEPINFSQSDAPPTSIFSEDSTMIVFRGAWGTAETSFVVATVPPTPFAEKNRPESARCRFEGNHRGKSLFQGEWKATLQIDGDILTPTDDWALLSEETDQTRSYWEIGLTLTGGFRLERSVLYVPDDGILLLADAILSEELSSDTLPDFDYESRFSLADNVAVLPDAEGNEIILTTAEKSERRTQNVRVLPLPLDEWRTNSPGEGFRTDRNELVFKLRRKGPFFAPILIDLDPLRLRRRYTWRRLTVGENMKKVPDHIAVGFRIHLGNDPFLLYRSLVDGGCRSVLGRHFDQETIFTHFDPDAEVDPILEISPVRN